MATPTRVVLVAYDDSANRYIACLILRHAAFVTIEASWRREAVEQAR